jgi:hypothetical protein
MGVEISPFALPEGAHLRQAEPQVHVAQWVLLQFQRVNDPPRGMSLNLSACPVECAELDRLREPASTQADVGGRLADVIQLQDGGVGRVRFSPVDGILAVVDVVASRDENVGLALQVARSLRTVDQETWDAALATRLPDGSDDGGNSTDTTAVASVTSTAPPR